LRRKIRAGFGCHISCRTFNDVHAALHKKFMATELSPDSVDHGLLVVPLKVIKQGWQDL